jgi:hypothetical protein
LLIHLTGSVIILGRRDDVLWQSLDASNVMLAQANSIKHYHGTLDGLDVLAMLPEYTTVLILILPSERDKAINFKFIIIIIHVENMKCSNF